jgi:hypothetical protein
MPNYTGIWIAWGEFSCLVKGFVAGWYAVICDDTGVVYWLTAEGIARLLARPF